MTDIESDIRIREHYSAIGFTERIKAALTTIAPDSVCFPPSRLATEACGTDDEVKADKDHYCF